MWFILVVLLVSLSGVAAGGCQFPPAPVPLGTVDRVNVESAVMSADASLGQFADGLPGGFHASLMWNGTLLLNKGYGFARSSSKSTPPATDDIFRLGSVTKVFTALLFLVARSQGLVHEDSLVSDADPLLLPNTGITLRQLGTHLSGLQREAPLPCRSDSSDCNYTTATMAPFVNALAPVFPTDTQPSYSNLGFAVLGRALEPVLGGQFESLLAAVTSALSMSPDSGFNLTHASRYAYGSGPRAPTDLGWGNPDGGMFATPADMQAFLRFLQFGNASVLSAALQRRWWLPFFALPDGQGAYGMPWEMQYFASGPAWVLSKSGDVQQFSCIVLHVPTLQLSMALLGNTPGSDAQNAAAEAFEIVLSALVAAVENSEPPPPEPPVPAAFMGKYTGYVDALGANLTAVVSKGMVMTVQVFDSSFPAQLSYVSGGEFLVSLAKGLPLSCLLATELAWDGESAVIENGTLQFPGMLPGEILYLVK